MFHETAEHTPIDAANFIFKVKMNMGNIDKVPWIVLLLGLESTSRVVPNKANYAV